MTEQLTAYTPLESLLLFQSLASTGLEPSAFSRTSDFLKNNDYIRNAKAYDSGRLSPDALRELYLALLKEEVRAELDGSASPEGQESNGLLDGASRKRKRSPSLLSVQEASKHAHLIPQLITRLYSRYRDHAIRDIREDERKHKALSQEIDDIEAGNWNEQLMRQDASKSRALSQTPTRASPSPTPPQRDARHISDQPEAQSGIINSTRPPNAAETVPDARITQEQPDLNPVKIDSVINHPLAPSKSENASSTVPNARVLPPPQKALAQSDPPNQQSIQVTRLPPPRPSNSGYRLNSPSVHQSPYAPSPPPHIPGPAVSPTLNPPLVANEVHPSSPSSAVVLPRPSAMQYLPPQSSVPTYPASTGYSPQQHGQSPSRYPTTPLASNEGQSPYSYTASQYPQYPGRSTVQHSHPAALPPHSGGIMLPPFQLDLQSHGRSSNAQQSPQSAAGSTTPSPNHASPISSRAIPYRTEQPRPRSGPTPGQVREIEYIAEMLIPKTSSLTTKWKKLSQSPHLAIPRSPTRPTIETLSPVRQRPASPNLEKDDAKSRNKPKVIDASDSTVEEKASIEEHPFETGRLSRTRNRKARGASVSSSAMASSVRGRTRSQSVMSHAESSAQDNEPIGLRTVKHEPPSTPAGSAILSDIAGSETTPTEARITRRRGGTIQSTVEPSQKRKRPLRELSESSMAIDMPSSSSDKLYIIASRNFQRTSLTIMNDITSHKYASYFAQPVTDRQAEGYHDIIYRSQDLRTIRGLITTGSKLISSMTSASTNTSLDGSQSQPAPLASPGGPSSASPYASNTVNVPAHPSIMPPSAIVNSSQLEKEIMRMFANAVMFNPGDEGLVRDARAMAEDVQGMVRAWRGAERTQRGTPVQAVARGKGEDEQDGGEAEQEEGTNKRRKV